MFTGNNNKRWPNFSCLNIRAIISKDLLLKNIVVHAQCYSANCKYFKWKMHSTEAMYQRQKTSLEFEISALWVHHDVSRIRNPSAGISWCISNLQHLQVCRLWKFKKFLIFRSSFQQDTQCIAIWKKMKQTFFAKSPFTKKQGETEVLSPEKLYVMWNCTGYIEKCLAV